MRVRSTPPPTLVSDTPSPVEFWIAPPVQVKTPSHVPPVPVTLRPPALPVLLSTMPFGAPSEAIRPKFRSFEWIVVPVTLRGRPVFAMILLSGSGPGPFGSVIASVPALVAVNPLLALVESVSPPSKRVVPPLVSSETLPPLIGPLKSFVPPVLF